jgi:hypothetical protein
MICEFTIEAYGDNADLRAFQAAVLKDTTAREASHSLDPGFLFKPKPEFWGNLRDGQDCLPLVSVTYFSRESVLGTGRYPQDHLVIFGDAKSLPIDFVELAANKFPRLDFDVSGTADDEFYDHWEATPAVFAERPRKIVCVEQRVTCRESREVLKLKIHGQRILPREDADE